MLIATSMAQLDVVNIKSQACSHWRGLQLKQDITEEEDQGASGAPSGCSITDCCIFVVI